jgi:hypothetical protein
MIPIIIILFVFIMIISLFSAPDSAGITRSTRQREPLDASYITAIDEYYHDGPGVIMSAADQYSLENSMKSFYQKTGVQPYLYIDDDINGNTRPGYDAVEEFMYSEYAALFGSDEGHLLILYFEYPNGEYNTWYMWGNNAHMVMDDEACEILLDYIDYNYSQYDVGYTLKYTQMFVSSFDSAAERIMGGRTSIFESMSVGTIILLILGVVGVIALIIYIVKRYKDTNPNRRGPDGGSSDNMSEEDRRKDKYRRRYGG